MAAWDPSRYDELLITSTLQGSLKARLAMDADEPDVAAMLLSLTEIAPRLIGQMRVVVRLHRTHGLEFVRNRFWEKLGKIFSDAMYCEMVFTFMAGAIRRQADPAESQEYLQGPLRDRERADYERLMRVRVSAEQAAVVERLRPVVKSIRENRCFFMQHYGCFTCQC